MINAPRWGKKFLEVITHPSRVSGDKLQCIYIFLRKCTLKCSRVEACKVAEELNQILFSKKRFSILKLEPFLYTAFRIETQFCKIIYYFVLPTAVRNKKFLTKHRYLFLSKYYFSMPCSMTLVNSWLFQKKKLNSKIF